MYEIEFNRVIKKRPFQIFIKSLCLFTVGLGAVYTSILFYVGAGTHHLFKVEHCFSSDNTHLFWVISYALTCVAAVSTALISFVAKYVFIDYRKFIPKVLLTFLTALLLVATSIAAPAVLYPVCEQVMYGKALLNVTVKLMPMSMVVAICLVSVVIGVIMLITIKLAVAAVYRYVTVRKYLKT